MKLPSLHMHACMEIRRIYAGITDIAQTRIYDLIFFVNFDRIVARMIDGEKPSNDNARSLALKNGTE